MVINDIYSIVNSVTAQSLGDSALVATDLTGLVSIGDSVLASDTNKDAFLSTLVDRIGKTIISQKVYTPEMLDVFMDSFTFGAILQKVYTDTVDAETDSAWKLTEGTTIDQYVISKATVKQKLFTKLNAWEIDLTIPDFQLKTAFTGEAEMAAFINSMFTTMSNSMNLQLESMLHMCFCNYIAEKSIDTNNYSTKILSINLLSEYNTLTGSSLTADKALYDEGFLKFAAMEIKLYSDRMQTMSTMFNKEGYKRFTDANDLRITMLSNFDSALTMYLQSNTYHKELLQLPKYNTIPFWQSPFSGLNKYDFATVSTVKVKPENGNSSYSSFPYVICVMSDYNALGITMNDRRSKSAYNAKGEYTNYFDKANIMYFNDMSENGIVFTLADAVSA